MVTTLFEHQGRQFGISTAHRGDRFVSCWLCFNCGNEQDTPECAATRQEAQAAAEAIARGHVCVQVTPDVKSVR